MCRLIHLILLLLLPLWAVGQGCGVTVKKADESDFRKALAELDQCHFREASQLLRRVAQRNPKAADPQFWLGISAVRNDFNTAAIRRYFSKCIELCPDYPNALAHYYMGMILYTDERYEEAATEMEAYFRMANSSDDAAQTAVYEEASAYLHWSHFLAQAELNRAPFDPTPLAGVSSKRNETLPFITHDGRRCYYLREVPLRKGRSTFYNPDVEKTVWKLFCSDWKDTAFSTGRELSAPFNQGDPEGGVSLTADGRSLFFSRIVSTGGYANSDLYGGRWNAESAKWEVERLEGGINGEKTWESQPSVSADGQWLYFASNRKGGMGGTDLWRCHRLKNGAWSRPENLGSRVNTQGNEKFPFIHADGHTLYFVSDGWQGFGGYDVYFIDLADGSSQPTNLGLPINSEGDELSFGVTADGHRAYFPGRVASSRSRDIVVFDLYPAARPEPMRCCRMKIITRHESRDTLLVLSERQPSVVTLDADGFLPAIRCGKARELDRCEVTLADSVSAMDFDDLRVTDALAAWLIEHPRVHVAIESPKAATAKAVYDYLVNQKKLRPERFVCHSGSEYRHNQIRLL